MAAPANPSKITAPRPRRDVGLAWLVLCGMLILAAVPLLIHIDRPAAWTEEEALAVAISTQTLERKAPISDVSTSMQAWTPVYEGISRWDLPPAGIWLHQVTFMGLNRSDGTAAADEGNTLLLRARLGSVAMALIFIAAVFWAGHCIGGVTTGAISALVAMTMPLVIGFGRHATADAAALGWSALSIAGAMWAIRPLRASPSLGRQLLGWLISGMSLALATLTAGPVAIPSTVICIFTIAMVCPRRIGHVMGLLASMAFAALLVTPWVLYVHDHDAEIWKMWFHQLTPHLAKLSGQDLLHQAGWRLSLAAMACGLWLVWLIPAITQPFSTSTGPARRKMLLGWVWLMITLALLVFAPGTNRLSLLLLTAAPVSICIGLVIQQFHDLSAEARHARLWLVCRWINFVLMLVLSLALPLLAAVLQYRPELVAWLPSLDRPLLVSMHWSFYAGSALALLLVSLLNLRFALGQHPGRTIACTAIWILISSSLAIMIASHGSLLNTPADPAPSPRISSASL